jgi:hypothetical protein
LDAVVRRMMAIAPAERFEVPKAAADALAPFAAGADLAGLVAAAREASLHPQPAVETVSPRGATPAVLASDVPVRRGRPLWRLAAGAALLAAVAALAWTSASHRRSGEGLESSREAYAPPPQPEVDPGPQPGAWYDASRREPTRLLWNNFKHDHTFDFDRGKRELQVTVPSESLVSFGRTPYAGYQIQLSIKQVRWTAGVGLFFGYHDDTLFGKPCRKCQVLELRPRVVQTPKKGFILERKCVWIEEADGRPKVTRQLEVMSATLDTPMDARPYLLSIRVGASRLEEIRWNDKPFPDLVGAKLEATAKLTPADYVGEFGAFNNKSHAVFGNVQLYLYERRSR